MVKTNINNGTQNTNRYSEYTNQKLENERTQWTEKKDGWHLKNQFQQPPKINAVRGHTTNT